MKGHYSAAAACVGKERYVSANLAHQVLLRRQQSRKAVNKVTKAYRCESCGGWHHSAAKQ